MSSESFWEKRAGELRRSLQFYASEADELRRYREREPLVQELLEAWNLWTGQEMYGELFREGMVPSDFEAWESTVDAVRDFCITPASTDMASEANAAGSSSAEPTK
jgi:hypothetical protein